MTTDFFGHAVLRFGTATTGRAICDPWFSRRGIFFDSWFQFPENAPLEESAFAGVADVLISHNHQDHYDPPVLRRALARNPDLRLHIARFPTPWFRRLIERVTPELATRLIEHEAYVDFELAGGRAFFVPEESPGQIDSAIVWTGTDQVVVNMNDARLNTGQLERIAARIGDRIDILALQASGASEYPVNYVYDEAAMVAAKREKRRLKFEACERVIDLLRPRRILFFAGPPVFLDPALESFNDVSGDSVFPDQLDTLRHYDEVRPDLAERCYCVLPGETLDDTRLWRDTDLADDRLRPFTRKLDYVAAYRERRRDVLDFALGPLPDRARLLGHFQRLATLSPEAAGKIGGALGFVVEGEDGEAAFTVDFRRGEARAGLADDLLYLLRAPASAVARVMEGPETWDDLFLSIRMTFDERSPRFVAHFKTLLKYLDGEIMTALDRYETGLAASAAADMFEVACQGRCHRIQKLCPHAGVDLSRHGRVDDDGTITCMAHRFRFDLETGACLNAEGFRLRVEE